MRKRKALRAAQDLSGDPDFERILADGIVDVASELRLLEVSELVAMIRDDQKVNIADLVNSASELYFLSGTLRYAGNADYLVRWDATPAILLDLELRVEPVRVFFRLSIARYSASVEILTKSFGETDLNDDASAELLRAAIRKARVCDRLMAHPSSLQR